jgi:hypothetical protein
MPTKKPTRIRDVVERDLSCVVGCDNEPVNVVKKTTGDKRVENVSRCREHTSRFDIVVLGPGPIPGRNY